MELLHDLSINCFQLIRPSGFEPLAFGSGDQRSIRAELRARSTLVTHFAGGLQWRADWSRWTFMRAAPAQSVHLHNPPVFVIPNETTALRFPIRSATGWIRSWLRGVLNVHLFICGDPGAAAWLNSCLDFCRSIPIGVRSAAIGFSGSAGISDYKGVGQFGVGIC